MQLITQTNVFNPAQREITTLTGGDVLATLAPVTHQPFILFLNGEPVLREAWDELVVADEDIVHVVYLPAGGGGGNKMAGIAVAVIAIAAAVVAGPAAAACLLGADSRERQAFAAVSAGVAGATTLAGAALVNTILPPPKVPSNQQQNALSAPSPTYTLNAQGNFARLGQAIPVHYGRLKFYPDYGARPIAEYADGAMFLTELLVIGWGYYDIEKIYLGDTEVGQVSGANSAIYQPGEEVTGFPTNSVETPVGIQVFPGSAPTAEFLINPNGTRLSNRARLEFVFPNGLYDINTATGDKGAVTIGWTIQGLQLDGSGATVPGATWYNLKTPSVRRSDQGRIGAPQDINFPAGWVQAKLRLNFFTEAAENDLATAVRNLQWMSIRAYLIEDDTAKGKFDGLTTLVVRSRTDAVVGAPQQNRKISVIATRKLPIYSGGAWTAPQATQSAAWAFADAIRNNLYGIGLTSGEYSLDDIVTLGGEGFYQFNGRFDQQIIVWEALTQILRAARAQPYVQGGVLRIARDRNQTVPVGMFGMRNILRDSFRMEYIPPGDQNADIVAVQYLDDQDWLPRVVAAKWDYSTADPDDTEVQVDLFGVTDREKAFYEAVYLAKANGFRRRLVTFSTEMEGFIPSLGDLIAVSHDMPSWGISGEVVAANGATLTLSEDVDWSAGAKYLILRRKDGTASPALLVNRGAADNEAVLPAPQAFINTGDAFERTYFALGGSAKTLDRLAIVTGVRPISAHEVEISATVDVSQVRDLPPPGSMPPPPGKPPIQDSCLAPAISRLFLSTNLEQTLLTIGWEAPACATLFDVEIANSLSTDPALIDPS